MARAADTLLLATQVGLPNVGVTIDTGHSLVAGENVAEAAVLLATQGGKLFHLHFNDNYRSWDDDMIVGSVHLVEFVELWFWLQELGYQGWYSMDQYPYREDGQGALRASVEFLTGGGRAAHAGGLRRAAGHRGPGGSARVDRLDPRQAVPALGARGG